MRGVFAKKAIKKGEKLTRDKVFFAMPLHEGQLVSGDWFNTFEDPASEMAKIKALHPVNKMGSVQEFGALCAFLSGEWGGFFSGTTILVDGGRSALMQDSEGYG